MTTSTHERAHSFAADIHREHPYALHPQLQVPAISGEIVAAYRPRAEALSRRIADRICHELAAFSDPAVSTLVDRSIVLAVDLFIDALAGAPARGHVVFDHYRWLGHVEALAGHDLDAMRAAHYIAMQETWAEVDVVLVDLDLPFAAHQALTQAVMDYQRLLHDQAVAGYAESRDSRVQLLNALLEGTEIEHLRQLAAPCWPLPDMLAVATTEASDAAVKAVSIIAGVVCGVRHRRIVVVADATIIEQVGLRIAQCSPEPVAVSWGVAPHEAPHALRWATRALRLVRQGDIVLPATRVVRCRDHRFELWQHADPLLSHGLMVDVLAPLLAEKPAQRDVLGETMLLWLQTRASAPVIAASLGVHDQTVRNRLRRIRAMFGDALEQPHRAAELMQALQALRGSVGR